MSMQYTNPFMVVFNKNGGLKSDEERCVFLGRDGYFGAIAVYYVDTVVVGIERKTSLILNLFVVAHGEEDGQSGKDEEDGAARENEADAEVGRDGAARDRGKSEAEATHG